MKWSKSNLIFLLLILITISCSPEKKTFENHEFNRFKRKFPSLDLPLYLRLDELHDATLDLYDRNSSDTIYSKSYVGIYGMLPDTTNYFGLITITNQGPVLTTYTKDGVFIDSVSLVVEDCPADRCIISWTETCVIFKDLKIFCVDSISSGESDSLNPIR
jgi:hypothetical protein